MSSSPVGLHRTCCVRCAKAQASTPGLACTYRGSATKCERCQQGHRPCLPIPQQMVPATNDLLHMSDGVAAAVERESADATARAAGLNRLQRTFTRELQAAVRLEGLHEPSGNQEPTVRELLASILAAVLETNRLLQQTGAALPAAASASPDLGVLPDDETVQPRASASPDLRSLPDEPPQPRSRTSPDPGVSSDEEPIRLYRRSPRVTRPLSAAAAEAAAYASDNDEEFMPPQRRASTGSPPFEGFDDADFE